MCSINHEKKAVFIHIPKSAGTYIHKNLEKYYGFKHYFIKRPDHIKFCLGMDKSSKSHENKIHGTLMYYKTSSYLNNIMGMNKEKWETYYKFCFVRNPYDRYVSSWNYCNKYNIPINFFINIKMKSNDFDYWHTFMTQTRHIINEKGKIGVDYIGKYETLEQDLAKILNNIGIYHIVHNKVIKFNTKRHLPYNEYYKNNDELTNKVNNIFKEDFDKLDYLMIDNQNIDNNESELNALKGIGNLGIENI